MLRKLLKYEIMATARIFLPLYALLLVMVGINKGFSYLRPEDAFGIPQAVAMMGLIALIVGIFVVTLVVTVQRFYKNLLGDEGYLMFTLPVSSHKLVLSKLLVAAMWNIVSTVMAVLVVIILAMSSNMFRVLEEFWKGVTQYGVPAFAIMFEIIVLALIMSVTSVLTIYAAIAIGNMASKYKLLAAVGVYIGFGMVEQTIMTVLALALGVFDIKGGWLEAFFNLPSLAVVQIMLIAAIFYMAIWGVLYYFVTHLVLKNKLNLE